MDISFRGNSPEVLSMRDEVAQIECYIKSTALDIRLWGTSALMLIGGNELGAKQLGLFAFVFGGMAVKSALETIYGGVELYHQEELVRRAEHAELQNFMSAPEAFIVSRPVRRD